MVQLSHEFWKGAIQTTIQTTLDIGLIQSLT